MLESAERATGVAHRRGGSGQEGTQTDQRRTLAAKRSLDAADDQLAQSERDSALVLIALCNRLEAPQISLATQWRLILAAHNDGAGGWRTHRELAPPGIGIDSDDSTKYAGEMSLIAHAALECHLRQG
jgi:hypothetical protein